MKAVLQDLPQLCSPFLLDSLNLTRVTFPGPFSVFIPTFQFHLRNPPRTFWLLIFLLLGPI